MRKPRLSRLQGFLISSAALIGTVVIISGLAVGWFFEHHVLTYEKERAVTIVQVQALRHLAAADFDLPRWSGTRKVFETFLRELPGVSSIKVYDAKGRIVWSDEPRLIGVSFPDNPHLARALRGEVATLLELPGRSEHLYERSEGYVAGAYVPITAPGTTGTAGVIETSQDVTAVVRGIRRTQRLIWGVAGGMGLALYAALAFVVRKASVKEQQAITQLEASHAAVLVKTEELQRANQALRETQTQLVEKERLAAAGQVVVGLHHAILNPLTGVRGALQVLKQAGMSLPDRAEALAQAEAGIFTIEQLVRRLPTLRRVVGTPYVGDTTMVDLERSCEEEARDAPSPGVQ
jgi:signal transduction histidine kinase